MSNQDTSVQSLFIRNLDNSVRSSDLRKLFEKYGPVRDVYIPLDYYTKEQRGFAYVQFDDSRDAEDAIKGEDGIELFGKRIKIEFARGDRKSSYEMQKKTRPYGRRNESRSRSRSRSSSRSRYYSRSRRDRRYYNDRRDRSRSREYRRRSRSRSYENRYRRRYS